MHLFQPDRPQSIDTVIRIFTILGVLLVILALVALFSDILGLLDRFRLELYLFVLGALLAYLMAPAVKALQRIVRKQWAAVLGAYVLLFAGVLLFGALLLTPFITQAQSLVRNLQNPSRASLVQLHTIQGDISVVRTDINTQAQLVANGRPVLQSQVQHTQSDLARLVAHVTVLRSAPEAATKSEQPGVQIPPSYINPIVARVNQLKTAYGLLTPTLDAGRLATALTDADLAVRQINTSYQKAASTPLLLLNLQTILDQHGFQVDLHDRFSDVLQQVNNQVALLLNNALSISLQASNLLLNIVLIFIISIYFLKDGARFVRWLPSLAPEGSRARVTRTITSLDQILGSYLRTQVLLALLAGIADATGAIVLGIPYAVVIFVSSFLLSLVPVIGPVILPIPPLAIALLFTPLPKPIVYLIWLLVGEQLVTNVIGPRLQAHNLRIHPLEAMAAALIGLPLAGLPGAFFAVPVVAFFHIVIREFAQARPAASALPAVPAVPERPIARP